MATDAEAGTIREFAPAKVNLCLHVTGQRADGYHLLDSLVAFAEVGDRLTARPAAQAALVLQGPFGSDLPAGPENLVLRASAGFGAAAAFTLEKHLPPASGIGGGSADAAAALRALARLTGRPLPPGLAASLGADVPVCLDAQPARMRGVGEVLDPVTLPEGWILLANPRVEVPTPAVFGALQRKDNPPLPDRLPDWPDLPALAGWLAAQRNDLEPPALAIAPVIADVLAALRAQADARIARMSGSGATCFALFDREAPAQAAVLAIRAAQPGWWVAAGALLPGQDRRETT